MSTEGEMSVVPGAEGGLRARAVGLARALVRTQLSRAARRGAGRLSLDEGAGRRLVRGEGPEAQLSVQDRAAYAALAWGGSKGLGRAYVAGQLDSEDLTALMRFLFRATEPNRRRLDRLARALEPVRPRGRVPRPEEDRRHVGAHYDLSNDFFSLMLDETMAYSCAIFEGTEDLHAAQVEKIDRLCRRLELRAGQRLLEIGTGWGGLAVHAATQYGVEVTTTTISAEQRAYAEERVRAAGLTGQVRVLGEHYRDLTGRYDAVVSVEMIEAVDWRLYDDFFASMAARLVDGGRLAMQAITITERSFDRAKRRRDFIAEMVFPGGCLPSVSALTRAGARAGLDLAALEDIGRHYPRTLATWRERVHAHEASVRALGLDERFSRLWDLYLAYCEAGFLEGHLSDVQMLFRPSGRR